MERRAYTVSIDPQKKRSWTKLDVRERKEQNGRRRVWQHLKDDRTLLTVILELLIKPVGFKVVE